MKSRYSKLIRTLVFAGHAMGLVWSQSAVASDERVVDPAVVREVGELARHLATVCPVSDVANQVAFDACRKAMFGNEIVQSRLSPITLWGRQVDPALPIKKANLTQFAPEVLGGMYMPLFMFDGTYTVTYSQANGLYEARLGVGFRNRLQPGQFPYPFWHEADKWSTYENAKSMVFWIDPNSHRARVVQFTRFGDGAPLLQVQPAKPPAFDGKWLWTDAQGKTQPAVTLFDGLFEEANPYKKDLEKTYRELALSLRESQCLQCHVPNNPNRSSRLVLLQSPAHAAAEIKRLLKQVQSDRMPVDEFGMEERLEHGVKTVLLDRGREFEAVVDKAHAWEREKRKTASGAPSSVQ